MSALILPWLAFVWGAGTPANPLIGGTGIPGAVFAEAAFAAALGASYVVTPNAALAGTEERVVETVDDPFGRPYESVRAFFYLPPTGYDVK